MEYRNGVSFEPLAMRLFLKKYSLRESDIESLKSFMFQLRNGLWFCNEMILDQQTEEALRSQANDWLIEYGFFSVECLFVKFRSDLRHVDTPEDFASFLRHLDFAVSQWKNCGFFCLQCRLSLDEKLANTAEAIAELFEEKDGMLALSEIEKAMPHLTAGALEDIRLQFLPEVHKMEISGFPCWVSAEAMPLPEDFSDKLTTAVDTLVALYKKATVAKLELALNLFYCTHFRKEYGLTENETFLRVCAKHYQGNNNVFPKTMKYRARTNDFSERAQLRKRNSLLQS